DQSKHGDDQRKQQQYHGLKAIMARDKLFVLQLERDFQLRAVAPDETESMQKQRDIIERDPRKRQTQHARAEWMARSPKEEGETQGTQSSTDDDGQREFGENHSGAMKGNIESGKLANIYESCSFGGLLLLVVHDDILLRLDAMMLFC